MRRLSIALTLAAILSLPSAAQNDGRMSAELAQKIVAGCAAHAAAKGQSHAIAVVDSGGHLVAALRMDGNGHGVMAFAQEKAQAAAAWGFPTEGMAEAVKGTPGFAAAPYIVTVGGGFPVYDATGTRLIGGAAASGEPPVDDENCIKAGIAAAGLRDSRAPRP